MSKGLRSASTRTEGSTCRATIVIEFDYWNVGFDREITVAGTAISRSVCVYSRVGWMELITTTRD